MRSTVRSPRSLTPWPLALRLAPQPTCVSLHGPLNLLSSQPSFLFLPGVTRNTALRQDTLVRRRGPPSTAEKGKRCLARQERRKVGTQSTLGRALPARVEWVHLRSSGGERKNATDVGDQHNVLRFPIDVAKRAIKRRPFKTAVVGAYLIAWGTNWGLSGSLPKGELGLLAH